MPDSRSFTPRKNSPLEGLPRAAAGIELAERPFVGKVNLRADAGEQAIAEAVHGVLGCPLPVEPNTVAVTDDYTVFWLGPDEWQIHCREDRQLEVCGALEQALAGRHAAVVDVSDYYLVLRLSGDKTTEVLSKAVPLDIHPRAFPPGRCAQTRFAHATVLLHKVAEDTVDLQVRWSFAEYVWTYILDGTREYRVDRD